MIFCIQSQIKSVRHRKNLDWPRKIMYMFLIKFIFILLVFNNIRHVKLLHLGGTIHTLSDAGHSYNYNYIIVL